MAALGIPVALLGAILLALSTELQQGGATTGREDGKGQGRMRRLLAVLENPRWLAGTGLFVVAIAVQLSALLLAPLPLVQPIGALAIVVTALLDVRLNRVPLDARAVRAIACCVVGIALFVVIASFTTDSSPASVKRIVVLLIVVAAVSAVAIAVLVVRRGRIRPIICSVAAGGLFGLVVSLAKTILDRVQQIVSSGSGLQQRDWLTAGCVLGIVVAGLIGQYVLQLAYRGGEAGSVVAALTVVDPIVSVTTGIVVLGEAHAAAWWTFGLFGIAAALAVLGVFRLARARELRKAESRPDASRGTSTTAR
jgi:drug/metabolite transporter (DMT)-like permease